MRWVIWVCRFGVGALTWLKGKLKGRLKSILGLQIPILTRTPKEHAMTHGVSCLASFS